MVASFVQYQWLKPTALVKRSRIKGFICFRYELMTFEWIGISDSSFINKSIVAIRHEFREDSVKSDIRLSRHFYILLSLRMWWSSPILSVGALMRPILSCWVSVMIHRHEYNKISIAVVKNKNWIDFQGVIFTIAYIFDDFFIYEISS